MGCCRLVCDNNTDRECSSNTMSPLCLYITRTSCSVFLLLSFLLPFYILLKILVPAHNASLPHSHCICFTELSGFTPTEEFFVWVLCCCGKFRLALFTEHPTPRPEVTDTVRLLGPSNQRPTPSRPPLGIFVIIITIKVTCNNNNDKSYL